MPYYPIDRVAIGLESLRIAIEDRMVDKLFSALEQVITSASSRIEEASRAGDEEYADVVTDEESSHVEELIGLMFVSAQTFITTVRNRLAQVSEICKKEKGRSLSFLKDQRAYDVLKFADPMRGTPHYTEIEVINAVANYWKHQEEWSAHNFTWDTTKMRDKEKRTIEIISAVGMSPYSSGNLRKAANTFGIASYNDLSVIQDKLSKWARSLLEKAQSEIASLP